MIHINVGGSLFGLTFGHFLEEQGLRQPHVLRPRKVLMEALLLPSVNCVDCSALGFPATLEIRGNFENDFLFFQLGKTRKQRFSPVQHMHLVPCV